jgi:hypothetical protein
MPKFSARVSVCLSGKNFVSGSLPSSFFLLDTTTLPQFVPLKCIQKWSRQNPEKMVDNYYLKAALCAAFQIGAQQFDLEVEVGKDEDNVVLSLSPRECSDCMEWVGETGGHNFLVNLKTKITNSTNISAIAKAKLLPLAAADWN